MGVDTRRFQSAERRLTILPQRRESQGQTQAMAEGVSNSQWDTHPNFQNVSKQTLKYGQLGVLLFCCFFFGGGGRLQDLPLSSTGCK